MGIKSMYVYLLLFDISADKTRSVPDNIGKRPGCDQGGRDQEPVWAQGGHRKSRSYLSIDGGLS